MPASSASAAASPTTRSARAGRSQRPRRRRARRERPVSSSFPRACAPVGSVASRKIASSPSRRSEEVGVLRRRVERDDLERDLAAARTRARHRSVRVRSIGSSSRSLIRMTALVLRVLLLSSMCAARYRPFEILRARPRTTDPTGCRASSSSVRVVRRAGRWGEEAEQGLQLGRRRSGRERLVGDVGEEDEPEPALRSPRSSRASARCGSRCRAGRSTRRRGRRCPSCRPARTAARASRGAARKAPTQAARDQRTAETCTVARCGARRTARRAAPTAGSATRARHDVPRSVRAIRPHCARELGDRSPARGRSGHRRAARPSSACAAARRRRSSTASRSSALRLSSTSPCRGRVLGERERALDRGQVRGDPRRRADGVQVAPNDGRDQPRGTERAAARQASANPPSSARRDAPGHGRRRERRRDACGVDRPISSLVSRDWTPNVGQRRAA